MAVDLAMCGVWGVGVNRPGRHLFFTWTCVARERKTFWSLYATERGIGQLIGRPSDLPEQIITTNYPEVLDAGVPVDPAAIHSFSSAHTYRIVYHRSEMAWYRLESGMAVLSTMHCCVDDTNLQTDLRYGNVARSGLFCPFKLPLVKNDLRGSCFVRVV